MYLKGEKENKILFQLSPKLQHIIKMKKVILSCKSPEVIDEQIVFNLELAVKLNFYSQSYYSDHELVVVKN